MKELLSNKGVFIGCMIFLLQQFSGVNSVVYFSSSVFAKVQSLPVLACPSLHSHFLVDIPSARFCGYGSIRPSSALAVAPAASVSQ